MVYPGLEMIKQLIRMIGAFGDGTEYVDFHKTLEQIENLQKRVSFLSKEIEAKIAEFAKLKYENRLESLNAQVENIKEQIKRKQCDSKTELIIRWGRRDKQSASIHVECVTQAQTTALANILRVVVDGEEELLGIQEVQKL